MKLDLIWDYFCISDHNLILNSYGDTHQLSWRKNAQLWYGNVSQYNKKEINTSKPHPPQCTTGPTSSFFSKKEGLLFSAPPGSSYHPGQVESKGANGILV
jgi:hypothetical protein